jgi:hypothetical protein
VTRPETDAFSVWANEGCSPRASVNCAIAKDDLTNIRRLKEELAFTRESSPFAKYSGFLRDLSHGADSIFLANNISSHGDTASCSSAICKYDLFSKNQLKDGSVGHADRHTSDSDLPDVKDCYPVDRRLQRLNQFPEGVWDLRI